MASMLLSAVAMPLPSAAASHRVGSEGGVRGLAWAVQGRWAGWQLGKPQAGAGAGAGRVVCAGAGELGGSRSSEGGEKQVVAGTRIRVRHDGPLKVFHVPKNPELDINGMEGEVKDVVTTFKGKPISATLPYKVQMVLTRGEESRKFFVHLKEDEFEVVE
jgi:hypothetical protein